MHIETLPSNSDSENITLLIDNESQKHSLISLPFSTRKFIITILILSLVGIFFSTILLYDHYQNGPLICDINETWSCSAVNQSNFSVLFGIPVAALGILWFLFEFVLALRIYNHLKQKNSHCYFSVVFLYLWNIFGLLFITYFIIAEFIIGYFCIYCTFVHITTFFCFIISWKLSSYINIFPELYSQLFIISAWKSLRLIFISFLTSFFGLLILFNIIPLFYNSQSDLSIFAQCLTSNHIYFYGNDYCGACQQQKKIFGEYLSQINYISCNKLENVAECSFHNIKKYPTWIRFSDNKKITELKRTTGFQSLFELKYFTDKCSSVFKNTPNNQLNTSPHYYNKFVVPYQGSKTSSPSNHNQTERIIPSKYQKSYPLTHSDIDRSSPSSNHQKTKTKKIVLTDTNFYDNYDDDESYENENNPNHNFYYHYGRRYNNYNHRFNNYKNYHRFNNYKNYHRFNNYRNYNHRFNNYRNYHRFNNYRNYHRFNNYNNYRNYHYYK